MLKPDPDGQVKRPTPAPLKYNRLDGPPRYNSDVKYEQQQPRRSSGVVYHYPTAPQRPRDEGQRQEQVDRSGHLSPRVYIPPPIFSPRRVHSTEAIPSQSSLQSTRAELMRPRSVASERAATMGEGSAAYRLQYLHQPYKPSTPAQPSSRELPKYPDYFGKGNEPLPSPIRESFVRSHPAQIRGVDATYREQHRSMRPTYKPSPVAPARPPLEAQGPHRDFSQDLRAHGRPALTIKRSAAELSFNQERHNTCVQQAASHISAPQELAAQHQPKRARTDSAESSTSGSNGSPPNRMRYIAPPAGHAAGNQLIPYLSAPKPCDSITAAQQLRHGPAFRSPSPAYSAAAESSIGQGTVSIDNGDLRSLIAEVIEGKADRSKTETARTLADVAATLAKVAESLKQSMN